MAITRIATPVPHHLIQSNIIIENTMNKCINHMNDLRSLFFLWMLIYSFEINPFNSYMLGLCEIKTYKK